MLQKIDLKKIIFLDIETVPLEYEFKNLPRRTIDLWDKKTQYIQKYQEITAEEAYNKAGIYAEFGKIVCISCGFFAIQEGKRVFRVKSFSGDNEKDLLWDFAEMLRKHFDQSYVLCAHNGKEFDFPYLSRRMVVNGITLPELLNTSGLKPWEIRHLDTMEMWKFGDYKHYSSVSLLAALFDIPTPKDDIDGSMVGEVYWKEKNLKRIVEYCQKDTVTVARIFLKMENQAPLKDEEIIIND